jgi:hypothetical protein
MVKYFLQTPFDDSDLSYLFFRSDTMTSHRTQFNTAARHGTIDDAVRPCALSPDGPHR